MNHADLQFWKSGWWNANDHRRSRTSLMAAFGLGPNAKLPHHHGPISFRGAFVYISARNPKKHSRFQHRLIVICPLCGVETSFGRIHQHIDTKACQTGRQPTNEIVKETT
jgi:hypothetical protein